MVYGFFDAMGFILMISYIILCVYIYIYTNGLYGLSLG